MKSPILPLVLNILSILCGIWFTLTAWIWVFIVNLFISFPVGVIGIILFLVARGYDSKSKLNMAAIIIHILGVLVAIVSLVAIVYLPKTGGG